MYPSEVTCIFQGADCLPLREPSRTGRHRLGTDYPPAGAASDAQTAGAFKQHAHRCIVKSVIVFKYSVLYAPLPHFIHFIAFLLCFVPDVSAEKPFVLTDVLNK